MFAQLYGLWIFLALVNWFVTFGMEADRTRCGVQELAQIVSFVQAISFTIASIVSVMMLIPSPR